MTITPIDCDQRRRDAERALAALLRALGVQATGELKDAPTRAAALWTEHLLAGEGADLKALLGTGISHTSDSPVCVTRMGVHLVCPHHLTVAFGNASIAYAPGGRVVGLGALSDLATACTSRFILQEQATLDMANALVDHLHAHAAVALVQAVHPCHNIPHPRSHRSRATTWAQAGHRGHARALVRALRLALQE